MRFILSFELNILMSILGDTKEYFFFIGAVTKADKANTLMVH
jgi:hypothetical protein